MVKPGGTGKPMRHISARLAPLPPSSGFIVPFPSVFLPNQYTYLPDLGAAFAVVFFPPLFFATTRPAFVFAIRLSSPLQFQKYRQCPGSDRGALPPGRDARREPARPPPSPAHRQKTSR